MDNREMVKRVAGAIWDALLPFDGTYKMQWADAETVARAAILASQLSGVVGERDDLLVQCSLHAENSTRLIEALEWASAYDPQLVEQIMARAALNNTGGQSERSAAMELLAERLRGLGVINDAENGFLLGGAIPEGEDPSV